MSIINYNKLSLWNCVHSSNLQSPSSPQEFNNTQQPLVNNTLTTQYERVDDNTYTEVDPYNIPTTSSTSSSKYENVESTLNKMVDNPLYETTSA